MTDRGRLSHRGEHLPLDRHRCTAGTAFAGHDRMVPNLFINTFHAVVALGGTSRSSTRTSPFPSPSAGRGRESSKASVRGNRIFGGEASIEILLHCTLRWRRLDDRLRGSVPSVPLASISERVSPTSHTR